MNPMFSDSAAYAVQRLQQLGWSPAAAVGMVGNLVQESGPNLNPTATHDGGTGFGIAGFRDPKPGEGRWTNLRNFAGQQGLNHRDLDTQLRFIDHELRTSESGVGNRLRNARDASEAARISIDFFRPEGWTSNNPTGGHGWNNRLQNAQTLARNVGAMPGNLTPPAPSTGGNAAYASMPAEGATPAAGSSGAGAPPGGEGGLQAMFMDAVNDRSIDPNDYQDGFPRSIGNVLAARVFMDREGAVPERLQGLINRDIERGVLNVSPSPGAMAPLPPQRPDMSPAAPAGNAGGQTALERAGIMPRTPDTGLGVFEMPAGGLSAISQDPASAANPGMPNAGGVMPLGASGPAAFGQLAPPTPTPAAGGGTAGLDLGGLASMFAGIGQPAPQPAGPDMTALAALMQPQQPQMAARGPTALDAAAMLQERERDMTRRNRPGRPQRGPPARMFG